MEEQQLIEKLRRIEALYAGAATAGERDAAGQARERIRLRMERLQETDPPVEFRFALRSEWARRLFVALLRRYSITPYRYSGQRRTTVMAKVSRQFVNETLWPEFQELNQTLNTFLADVTERVIKQGIGGDRSDVEVRPSGPDLLNSSALSDEP